MQIVLGGDQSGVKSAAFSPDGARILTASADRTVRIWDAATGKLKAFLGHESANDLLAETCKRCLLGLTKLARDEMRLAGYSNETSEIDVCAGIN